MQLNALRRTILRLAYQSGEGHVPSSLSVLEIIWTLYDKVMGPDDIFILSKGHAALALYAVLNAKGIIPDEMLETFGNPKSTLYGHPDIRTPGVYCSTGSLGHGAAVSVGAAYAKRLRGESGRVFCLIGDGESEEGGVWEAAQLAARFQLDNLVWIVDCNGTSPNNGYDSIDVLVRRFMSFGFMPARIEVADTLMFDAIYSDQRVPAILCWPTFKGHGIPEMMADPQAWHRKRMRADEYERFMGQLA